MGIVGIAAIIFAGFNYLLSPVLESANTISSEVEAERANLQKNKDTMEKIKRLKSEAEANPTAMLTLGASEISTVKVYDFVQNLQNYSQSDPLGLGAPHNSVELLGFNEVEIKREGSEPQGDGQVTENIFSSSQVPFSVDELSDLNLNVQAQHYRYEIQARGTFVGLMNFVKQVAVNKPFAGIHDMKITIDDKAPNILKFAPIPQSPANSSIKPEAGKASSETNHVSTAVGSSKTGAPLLMNLIIDVYLKSESPQPGAVSQGAAEAEGAGPHEMMPL